MRGDRRGDDAVMKPFFTCQTALLKALEDAWQTRLFSLFVSASGIIASIAAGSAAVGLLSQQHDLLKALLLFLVVLLGLGGSLFFLFRFLKQIPPKPKPPNIWNLPQSLTLRLNRIACEQITYDHLGDDAHQRSQPGSAVWLRS